MTIKQIFSWAAFFAGLILLISLGSWQLYRAGWKDGVIERLEIEYAKNPYEHPLVWDDLNSHDDEFFVRRGVLEGTFVTDQTLFWPKVKDGVYGFDLADVLEIYLGGVVLVNRGWVAEDPQTHLPSNIPALPEGKVTIAGLARPYEASVWALENRPEDNLWYRYQPSQFEEVLKLAHPLPEAMFFAEEIALYPEALANTERVKAMPSDNHMNYALFWFTLALIWAGMIGGFLSCKR